MRPALAAGTMRRCAESEWMLHGTKWRDRVRKHPWYYKLLLVAGLGATIEWAWKAFHSAGWTRLALVGLVLFCALGLTLACRLVVAAERYNEAPAWWYSEGPFGRLRRDKRERP